MRDFYYFWFCCAYIILLFTLLFFMRVFYFLFLKFFVLAVDFHQLTQLTFFFLLCFLNDPSLMGGSSYRKSAYDMNPGSSFILSLAFEFNLFYNLSQITSTKHTSLPHHYFHSPKTPSILTSIAAKSSSKQFKADYTSSNCTRKSYFQIIIFVEFKDWYIYLLNSYQQKRFQHPREYLARCSIRAMLGIYNL